MNRHSHSQQSSDETRVKYVTHADYNHSHRLGRFKSITSIHVSKYTISKVLAPYAGSERRWDNVVWLNNETKHILNPASEAWSDTEFETFRDGTGRYRECGEPRYTNFDGHTAGKSLKQYDAIDNARKSAGRPFGKEDQRKFTPRQSSVRGEELSSVEPFPIEQFAPTRAEQLVGLRSDGGPGQDGDGERRRSKKKKKTKGGKRKHVANDHADRDPGQPSATSDNLSTIPEATGNRVWGEPIFHHVRIRDVDWAALGAKRIGNTNRQ